MQNSSFSEFIFLKDVFVNVQRRDESAFYFELLMCFNQLVLVTASNAQKGAIKSFKKIN